MEHQSLLRETYIEINLDRIEHNIRAIRSMCGPGTAIGAVVKADAYGHGAVALAPVLMEMVRPALRCHALGRNRVKAAFPKLPCSADGTYPERVF